MLENINSFIGGLCLVSVGLMFGYILSDTKLTKNKKIITIIIIIVRVLTKFNTLFFF